MKKTNSKENNSFLNSLDNYLKMTIKEANIMRKVKYRLYLNYPKEEKWINEMSQQGWHLEKFSLGKFTFEKGEPGKYIYRSELLGDLKKGEKEEYFEFLEESGITVVHHFANWIYTRRETSEGPFELFTNNQSYINYYNRILAYLIPLFLLNLGMGILNLYLSAAKGSLGWLNISIATLNGIATIIILLPIYFIYKEKTKLQKEQQFFE